MVKIKRKTYIITAAVLLVGICIILLAPLAATAGWKIIYLPFFDLQDKGNSKLDSRLNQLVCAEMRGEAASFARQTNIELIDGDVRVIVECVPGQVDAAMEAATEAGAKLETSYQNLLQVVMPINSLTTLADAASIHFIRLPQHPLPGVTSVDRKLINKRVA